MEKIRKTLESFIDEIERRDLVAVVIVGKSGGSNVAVAQHATPAEAGKLLGLGVQAIRNREEFDDIAGKDFTDNFVKGIAQTTVNVD